MTQAEKVTLGGAGEAFRDALCVNANLGGDCVNRGALLGSILGATLGARNIPKDLLEGLLRRPQLQLHITALSQRAVQHGAGPQRSPRLGHPRAMSHADVFESEKFTAVRPASDLPCKLEAVQRDHVRAREMGGFGLRYVRGVGACALVKVAGGRGELTLVALSPPSLADPRAAGLDLGEAAKDSSLVLASLHGTPAVVAKAENAVRWLTSSVRNGLTHSLEDATNQWDTATKQEDSSDDSQVLRCDRQPGTGYFFYAPPSELATRIAALKSARGTAAASNADPSNDAVRIKLRETYGFDVEIRPEWLAASVAEQTVAPEIQSGAGSCDA